MSKLAYAEPAFPAPPSVPLEPQGPRYPAVKKPSFTVGGEASTPRNQKKTACACVTVAAILIVIVAQLLLSVGLSQGAYRLEVLHKDGKELARTSQSVSHDLQRLSSPQNLAANAEALGMVKNASPVYLRLSDGAVLGRPSPAASHAGVLVGSAGVLVPNSLLDRLARSPGTPSPGPNGGQSVPTTH